MGLNNVGLGIIFTAKDFASRIIGSLGANFTTLGGKANVAAEILSNKLGISTAKATSQMKRLAKGVALVGVGLVALSKLGGFVEGAADLETILVRIQQKSGLTADQIKELRGRFLELTAALPLGVEELAKVGVVAAQLGLKSVSDIENLAFSSAKLARVTEFTSEEAALALGRLAAAFKLPIADADKLASVLLDLGDSTKSSAVAINRALVNFAPFAGTIGLTADKAAAFTATLTEMGVRAELAGSGLIRLFVGGQKDATGFGKVIGLSGAQFEKAFGAKPGETIERFLRQLNTIEDGGGRVIDVLEDLGLSGSENIRVISILRGNLAALGKGFKVAGGAIATGESINRKFAISMSDLNSKIDTLEGSLETAGKVIGNVFIPVSKVLVDIAAQIVGAFLKLPEAIQEFIGEFLGVAAITSLVVGLKLALTVLFPVLKLFALFLVPFVIPLLKALVVIGLIVGAVKLLRLAFEDNLFGVKDLFDDISLAVRSLIALFIGGKISGALADDLAKAENLGIRLFITAIFEAMEKIKGIFRTGFEGIKLTINAVMIGIVKGINATIKTINAVVIAAADLASLFPGNEALVIEIAGKRISEVQTPQIELGEQSQLIEQPPGRPASTRTIASRGRMPGPIVSRAAPAPSNDLVQALAGLAQAGREDRSITIVVEMDGRELAKARVEQDRDNNARQGNLRSSIGR